MIGDSENLESYGQRYEVSCDFIGGKVSLSGDEVVVADECTAGTVKMCE
jgi:hypothetical protein